MNFVFFVFFPVSENGENGLGAEGADGANASPQNFWVEPPLICTLSPFHCPQNAWPWKTLNCLNGHFTLNFHYYELPLSNYFLLIYCRVFLRYTCDQRRCAGNWVANRDPHNIWNPWKNCGSFVLRRRYIVWTLTKNSITQCLIALPATDTKTRDLQWPWMAILR